MTLATLMSIREKNAVNLDDIMERFCAWLYNGDYTPSGETFDEGITCSEAISRYRQTKDCQTCGRTGEHANGNGALMRIMPVCLFAYEKQKAAGMTDAEAIALIDSVSALTHNHLRNRIACGLYYFITREILDGKADERGLFDCLQAGLDKGFSFYEADEGNETELSFYARLRSLAALRETAEASIKSSGYVVDTIEAAVWSLVRTKSFSDALLTAVNLGDDSDTVAAIAGGLAGLYYGYDSIPREWLSAIIRREWIEGLCDGAGRSC